MTCQACKREKPIAGRGFCKACYQRWHKTGSTEYQRWGKTQRCQIKDCENQAVAGGLCDKHRKRLERHGSPEMGTRPDSWGAIEAHPLSGTWRRLSRFQHYDVDPTWREDFLQFVVDVGDRPSSKHKLFPADETKPFGPGNFVWKRAITERVAGEDEKTYRSRMLRVYRSVRKEAFKGYDLKRMYGLSLKEYEAMRAKQGDRCLICGATEEKMIRGKKLNLAIDHCHATKRIRGLLCADCNRGLGMFKDKPELLERAAQYLRWPE